jgi:hypothetical protein
MGWIRGFEEASRDGTVIEVACGHDPDAEPDDLPRYHARYVVATDNDEMGGVWLTIDDDSPLAAPMYWRTIGATDG